MIVHELKQGTPEWHAARLGMDLLGRWAPLRPGSLGVWHAVAALGSAQ